MNNERYIDDVSNQTRRRKASACGGPGWRLRPADPQEYPRAQDCVAIVTNDPEGRSRLVAWVVIDGGDSQRRDASDAQLIETAPLLLAWLEKAVQMAGQQVTGGEDKPAASAWKWLEEQAATVIARAKGVCADLTG